MKCPHCKNLILTRRQIETLKSLTIRPYTNFDLHKITGTSYSYIHGMTKELQKEGLVDKRELLSEKNIIKYQNHITKKGLEWLMLI